MVRKQEAKNNKKRKVSRAVKSSKLVKSPKAVKASKKNAIQKKQNVALFKSAESKLKQLSNYKEFIRHLLSGDDDNDIDCELANGD